MNYNTDIMERYLLLPELNLTEIRQFARDLKIKNASKLNKEMLTNLIELKLKKGVD